MRKWKLLVWDGKKYHEANCGDFRFDAKGPGHAVTLAGLDDPMYTVKYSRVGYGYYTGKVYVYAPETIAAGEHQPADFILQVVE